jgi:translation initiation factor IF-3
VISTTFLDLIVSKAKEIRLTPSIDPHDFGVKLQHGVDFLSAGMKVKLTLRFRGREIAHKEFGFQQLEKLVKNLASFGRPDAAPKLISEGISVRLSPLRGDETAQGKNKAGPPQQ